MTKAIAYSWVAAALLFSMARGESNCPPSKSHIIRSGVGNSEPLACYTPDPEYTGEAAKAKVKGTVHVSATIGKDGCAHEIKIMSALGHGLDDSVVSAIERWRFRRPQQPMPVQIEINFDPKTSAMKPVEGPRWARTTQTKP